MVSYNFHLGKCDSTLHLLCYYPHCLLLLLRDLLLYWHKFPKSTLHSMKAVKALNSFGKSH